MKRSLKKLAGFEEGGGAIVESVEIWDDFRRF